MNSNGSPKLPTVINRRTAIGFGVATGLIITGLPADEVLGKTPPGFLEPDMSPQLKAAYAFAVKKNFKSGPGYWAVAYSEDNFTGEPILIGDPPLIPKPQAGAMPPGWGATAGSIVVGPSAVLRLIHKVNGKDVHVTLLPCESMADMRTMGIIDGVSTWKLFPSNKLQPPY